MRNGSRGALKLAEPADFGTQRHFKCIVNQGKSCQAWQLAKGINEKRFGGLVLPKSLLVAQIERKGFLLPHIGMPAMPEAVMGTVLWSLLDERSDEIDVAEVAAEFLAVGDVDEHFQRLGGVHEALRGSQLA